MSTCSLQCYNVLNNLTNAQINTKCRSFCPLPSSPFSSFSPLRLFLAIIIAVTCDKSFPSNKSTVMKLYSSGTPRAREPSMYAAMFSCFSRNTTKETSDACCYLFLHVQCVKWKDEGNSRWWAEWVIQYHLLEGHCLRVHLLYSARLESIQQTTNKRCACGCVFCFSLKRRFG